jgi:hypothetical protein
MICRNVPETGKSKDDTDEQQELMANIRKERQ